MESAENVIIDAGGKLHAIDNFDSIDRQAEVLPERMIGKCGYAAGRIHAQVNGHPVWFPVIDRFSDALPGRHCLCHGPISPSHKNESPVPCLPSDAAGMQRPACTSMGATYAC
jgi:hypothetical protein